MSRIHLLGVVLLAAFLGSSAAAQQVALSEDFSGTQFPPAGWTELQLGPSTDGWEREIPTQRAWHDYFLSGLCENYLISPPMDLSGFTQAFLHFEGETVDPPYLANHPQSLGNGIGRVEVTTDGGLTWTPIWNDTSTASFFESYSPSVSLSAFVGMTDVQLGFYYYGDYAQGWLVDNVIVDDTPVPILASLVNPTNGHPYFLLGESDFDTAQAMANLLGGNLTTISSLPENNWVQSTFGNFGGTQRNLMIGLTDRALEGTFTWISGEGEEFRNWAVGEPNNGGSSGEDYVEITSAGTWNDFDGARAYGVVEISQPRISSDPLVAGQLATITVSGLRTGSFITLVFSVVGNGPTSTPYGILEVDADMITPSFPSQGGQFNFSTYVPSNLAGRTLYGQGIQFHSDQSTDLSEPFAEPIQ